MELQEPQPILFALNWTLTNLPAIASLVYAVSFIAFLLYIYTRAGSIHFLRDSIWRIMGGKSDFLIPELQKLKLEARELEHFRFEFGVPAKTIQEIQKFESWVNANKLSLKDIAKAREHINWSDYDQLKIKDKNLNTTRKLLAFFGITFMTLSALSFLATAPNYLMASFDDSPYFYISTTETKFSMFGEEAININTCSDKSTLTKISQEINFPLQRIQTICEAYTNEEQLIIIKNKIKDQRTAALSLSIFFALVMFYFARESAKIYAAQRILKTLNSTNYKSHETNS